MHAHTQTHIMNHPIVNKNCPSIQTKHELLKVVLNSKMSYVFDGSGKKLLLKSVKCMLYLLRKYKNLFCHSNGRDSFFYLKFNVWCS